MKVPTPNPNTTCSRSCPFFHTVRMEGWPSADSCYAWDEKKDGKEPYYLSNTAQCKPAVRLLPNKIENSDNKRGLQSSD